MALSDWFEGVAAFVAAAALIFNLRDRYIQDRPQLLFTHDGEGRLLLLNLTSGPALDATITVRARLPDDAPIPPVIRSLGSVRGKEERDLSDVLEELRGTALEVAFGGEPYGVERTDVAVSASFSAVYAGRRRQPTYVHTRRGHVGVSTGRSDGVQPALIDLLPPSWGRDGGLW